MIIIIMILWFASAILMLPDVAPETANLSKMEKIIVCLVILLGAPFMLITQAIELILDSFIDGGQNEDKFKQ